MKVCCVEGCSGPPTTNPVFFEFPTSRLLRKRWLDAIKRSSVENDEVVCILHFARGDYDVVRGESRLRSRVIPSKKIGESEDEDSDSESSESESEKEDRTKVKQINNKNLDNKKTGKVNENLTRNKKINKKTQINGEKVLNDERNLKDDKILNDRKISNDEINLNDEKVLNDEKISNEEKKKDSSEEQNLKNSEEISSKDNCVENATNAKSSDTVPDNDRLDGHNHDEANRNNEENHNDKDKVLSVNEKLPQPEEMQIERNDAEKSVNSEIKPKPVQGRKTKCKITAKRTRIRRRRRKVSTDSSTSSDSISSSSPEPFRPSVTGDKEDIEESLQHYYIENKKTERQVAAMIDVLLEEQEKRDEEARKKYEKESTTEVRNEGRPEFVELSVGQSGATTEGQTENDCLMLLEKVQCEVDPTILLEARAEDEANMEQVDLDDDDDDEPIIIEKKKEDPISLLTSSDEDDVIIQEPKIDTVEVSSADSSEDDDMPLVKLVKPVKDVLNDKSKQNLITQLLWGKNDFYCVQCRYTTSSSSEYTKHMATHSKVFQLCNDCGFTSSSKHQMLKHKQKHKTEKRFHCRRCTYSAKHKMSLVYHMKTHNSSVNEVELAICGTFDPEEFRKRRKKSKKVKKIRYSEGKRYKCSICVYKTDRKTDMKRHIKRKHPDEAEDDDYTPGMV